MLEVPAAGLAAQRRTPAEIEGLRATLYDCTEDAEEIFQRNRDFHAVLLRASGSPLVEVVMRPIFRVLDERFLCERAPAPFWSEWTATTG